MAQRTVDAHNHWYPKEYLEYLMTRGDDETPYMRHDGGSHYRGYYKGVACCHIEDYQNNIILKHEKTRSDKEDDRTRVVDTLNAHPGPVFLTYRDDREIDAIVAL